MARKKISKTAKRRLTVITPIVFLAIGYCVFTLVTTAFSIYKLNVEEASLKEELSDLKSESKDLKNEINKLQDKDYVARYARENYLYTKDGEYVIKVDDEEDEADTGFEVDNDYVIFGCLVFGFLILFYLFVKSRRKRRRK